MFSRILPLAKFASPVWSYLTEQVPVPLVIVNVAPVFEHEPALENVTALPEPPPVAATEKLVPNTALPGACCVTVIDCDRDLFRKRVLPQTENFVKARPEAKPIVDIIHGTQA